MIKKCVLICGYECNNNCSFCCNSEKRGRVRSKSTHRLKEEILGLKKQGYSYLELIGGEPTIRKDIIDLVSFAGKLDFETIMLASNGRMFSYPSFTKEIVRAGLNTIVFSIHGHTAKLHDHLVGVEGAFGQLLRGIENVKKYRVQTGTNTTIVKQNYRFLPDIGKFIYGFGIRNAEFIFVDPTHGRPKRNFTGTCPTHRETEPYINRLLGFGYDKKIPHWHIRYYPLCFVNPKYHGMISELHEEGVFQTTHMAPDFINRDVKESRETISKVKTAICSFCKYAKQCEGVWREYFLRYGIDDIREKMRGGLTEAKLELTYDCDKNCSFCYNRNSPKYGKGLEMDKELAKRIIDIMARERIPVLRLSGGEPALHKNLHEIASYARQKGLKTILNTNGLVFEKFGKNLTEKIDEIFIPYNFPCSFKTIGEYFQKTESEDVKPKTSLVTVLTQDNINRLEKYLEEIGRLGISNWCLLREVPVSKTNNIGKGSMKKLFDFLQRTKKGGISIKIDNNMPFCVHDPEIVRRHVSYSGVCLGESCLVISPEGEVRICNSLQEKIGMVSLKTSSIKKFWKSGVASDFRNLKILPRECRDCGYLPECRGGCRFAAKITGGSYHGMDPLADPDNIRKKQHQLSACSKIC